LYDYDYFNYLTNAFTNLPISLHPWRFKMPILLNKKIFKVCPLRSV
jgi:hypothetical protein